jgi:hypothetical protein
MVLSIFIKSFRKQRNHSNLNYIKNIKAQFIMN